MIVGLDEEKTQHAGLAFDLHSSLILIEVSDESIPVLPLVARRIRRQVRLSDSVLLLEKNCALVLSAVPFSGAQAVANRIAPLLAGLPCELRAYHGTTALLLLQRLREAGARFVSSEECAELPIPKKNSPSYAEARGATSNALPYLASLPTYPPPRLLHLFPYELACRYQCIPVGAERKILTLATYRRLTREVIGQLRVATCREIFQVRCEMTMIDEVLHYWRRLQEKADSPAIPGKIDEVAPGSR
jgi:hypothetical protein